MRQDDTIRAMRADIRADGKMLRVKRRVVRILERLPDDDARRRVVMATSILLGVTRA